MATAEQAVLESVASTLIAEFDSFTANNCKVTPDELPHPVSGTTFVSIYGLNFSGKPQWGGQMVEEFMEFGVTISKKLHAAPYDRVMYNEVFNESVDADNISFGLSQMLEMVKFRISNRWDVCNTAVSNLSTGGKEIEDLVISTKILQPPQLVNKTAKIRFHDEQWFHGKRTPDLDPREEGAVGISGTHYFGNVLLQTKLAEET